MLSSPKLLACSFTKFAVSTQGSIECRLHHELFARPCLSSFEVLILYALSSSHGRTTKGTSKQQQGGTEPSPGSAQVAKHCGLPCLEANSKDIQDLLRDFDKFCTMPSCLCPGCVTVASRIPCLISCFGHV
eukprot:TRINITY_DN12207_c2_g2_i6.p1 TRINITY_DN12207_c2_g2~~TRINITY_DN12207_c2_g2_i6.p1  ORF type:complete len:131 (-),score=4.03 TRINITY_DN12207_c2_g2_i6:697-1089(-)